jgi:hypothetical protein
MVLEALLVSLILSIGFFLFEFFRMKNLFQDSFRQGQFFSGFGPGKMKVLDSVERKEGIPKMVENRFSGLEGRLSNQERVIEKLIKEISGVNA